MVRGVGVGPGPSAAAEAATANPPPVPFAISNISGDMSLLARAAAALRKKLGVHGITRAETLHLSRDSILPRARSLVRSALVSTRVF